MSKNIIHMKGNKPISFSLDTLAKAVYITFSNNQIAKTVRKNSSFSFDYDKDEKLVGIEIIRLQKASLALKKVLKDTEDILSPKSKRVVESLISSLI